MKTKYLFLSPILFLLFCFLIQSNNAFSQTATPSAFMEVKNCVQTSTNTFEYDVFLTNIGTTTFDLRGYSWGLKFVGSFSGC